MAEDTRSVIGLLVPCYNAAGFLPELFACIRSQTVPFREVICYDDASTDNTYEVASSFGARVIRGEVNHGAAYARNRLLEATSCDWVHFHDADDLMDPAFVETMTKDLEEHGRAVLCGIRVVDRDTGECTRHISYERLNRAEDFVAYFLENDALAIMGVYPASALRQIGGFRDDLRGNEDPDLHVRLALAGYSFRGEPMELVTNMEHKDSFSFADWGRCMRDRLGCFEGYFKDLGPRYWPAMGRQVADLAWRLYMEGYKDESRRAVRLAKKAGVRGVNSPRRLKRMLSRIFGFEIVFWLQLKLMSAGLRSNRASGR